MKTKLKPNDVVVIEHRINKRLNGQIGVIIRMYLRRNIIVVESLYRYGHWWIDITSSDTSLTKIGEL